ncbi:MAG: hypothetical protein R3A10_10215 [Caldilineaceae bacterium]
MRNTASSPVTVWAWLPPTELAKPGGDQASTSGVTSAMVPSSTSWAPLY